MGEGCESSHAILAFIEYSCKAGSTARVLKSGLCNLGSVRLTRMELATDYIYFFVVVDED